MNNRNVSLLCILIILTLTSQPSISYDGTIHEYNETDDLAITFQKYKKNMANIRHWKKEKAGWNKTYKEELEKKGYSLADLKEVRGYDVITDELKTCEAKENNIFDDAGEFNGCDDLRKEVKLFNVRASILKEIKPTLTEMAISRHFWNMAKEEVKKICRSLKTSKYYSETEC